MELTAQEKAFFDRVANKLNANANLSIDDAATGAIWPVNPASPQNTLHNREIDDGNRNNWSAQL